MNELTDLSRALLHSRRTFLLRTISTAAFPMSLAACGGGDDNANSATATDDGGATVTLTKTPAKGTIVMPAGATVQIASVTNAFGGSVPAPNGTFDFVSVAESTMLAIGTGPNGGAVLYGLVQDGAAELSPRSTAAVLAYHFLGVGVYVGDMQVAYLKAINASPSLDALQTAVAAAIVARGEGWLQTSDTALVAAISGVQKALSVNALITAQATSNGQADTPAGRVHALGIIQDKTERVSGLQVVNDGVGAFKISNYHRRRSYAYVDRVSYKTSFQAAPTDSQAAIGSQPTKVDATKAITNSLVTIAQYFAGTTDFYDPVVSGSFPTPLAPDSAVSTTYTMTSVGLGGSAGDLSLLSAAQQSGLLRVCAEAVLLDFIAPILSSILLPARDLHSGGAFAPTTFAEAATSGLLKDVLDTVAAADDILHTKYLNPLASGARLTSADVADVIWDVLVLILSRDTLKNAILLFFQSLINQIGGTPGDFINQGAKKLLDFTAGLDLGLQLMDTAVSGLQVATCDVADRFTLEVTKANVKLNPLNPTVDYPTPVTFTLSVIDSDLAPGTELSYTWNCSCAFGDISDSAGHVSTIDGTTFNSISPTLTYTPNTKHGRGGDQDVITGTVYVGPINHRTGTLGKASSTVTYDALITPSPVQLVINTQQTFTADMSTALVASGAALLYVWTLNGAGSIGASSVVTTTTPSISYVAPATTGADSLTLSVTNSAGTVIAKGSTNITVLGSVVAGIAPQNPQVPRSTVLNFVVNPLGASFPDGTTFKWVLTGNLDLYGHPTDLGGSGGGAIGVNISPPATSGPPMGTSMTVVTTRPSITFAANPFGPEAIGDSFSWYPRCDLVVSVLGAGGTLLATSSTPIQTQLPHGILLP